MTTHPNMNALFGLLDKWRHFPAFPLEARSEVLFALFVPTVLEAHFKKEGIKIKSQVIPQFPLKQKDIREENGEKKRNNLSNNVDFFALSEDRKHGFLIELKTDMSSIDKKQMRYLERAKNRGMQKVLEDLRTIARVKRPPPARKKYYHLLSALAGLDLIELDPLLGNKVYGSNSEGVYDAIGETKMLKSPTLEVVYIQPREPKDPEDKIEGFEYIYFDEFAEIVKNQGKLGRQFACYLREWKTDPAIRPPD